MSDDPLYYYVRDKGSAIAHHWDYLRGRNDHALCGHPYRGATWEGEDRPRSVCRACQAMLPAHEARWWKARAEVLQDELDFLVSEAQGLRAEIVKLKKHAENQRQQLRQLNATRGQKPLAQGGRADGRSPKKPAARSSGKRGRKSKSAPDNSREAVEMRLREETGPLAAANISARWRPTAGHIRVVRGGLPGLGKRR